MRKWINLVEAATPPVLFHGSNHRVEMPYRALTHFGTELAANQRALSIASRDRKWTKETGWTHGDAVIWMHPVHVSIANPLRINDGVNLQHHPIKLADMLFYDLKVIRSEDRSAIFNAGKFSTLNDLPAATAEIIRILAEKGYDGFVYRNIHEDPGSTSWVNFYSEQVTSAGEPWSDKVD